MDGVCMAGVHVWQGACMAREHAWQGGMHGRGMHGRGCAYVVAETATAVDGTHPTGMHSCFFIFYSQIPLLCG